MSWDIFLALLSMSHLNDNDKQVQIVNQTMACYEATGSQHNTAFNEADRLPENEIQGAYHACGRFSSLAIFDLWTYGTKTTGTENN